MKPIVNVYDKTRKQYIKFFRDGFDKTLKEHAQIRWTYKETRDAWAGNFDKYLMENFMVMRMAQE